MNTDWLTQAIKKFLGEESPLPVVFQSPPPMWLVLLVLAPLSVLLVAGAYMRLERAGNPLVRVVCAGLRLLAVAVLVLVLSGPVLRREEKRTEGSTVVILLDDSLSMAHRDKLDYAENRELARVVSSLGEKRHTRLEALFAGLAKRGAFDLGAWERLEARRKEAKAAREELEGAYDAARLEHGPQSAPAKAARIGWEKARDEEQRVSAKRRDMLNRLATAVAEDAPNPGATAAVGSGRGASAANQADVPLSSDEAEALLDSALVLPAGPRRMDIALELLAGSGPPAMNAGASADDADGGSAARQSTRARSDPDTVDSPNGAVAGESSAGSPRGLAAALRRAGHDVLVYRFSDLVSRPGRAARLLVPVAPDRLEYVQPRGYRTRIGDALLALGKEVRGRNLAGVVLVTDARSNAGEGDIQRAAEELRREAGTEPSIHVVLLGFPDRTADTELFSVSGTTQVMKKDAVVLDLWVRSTPEYAGKEARLEVTRNREPVPIKAFSSEGQVRKEAVLTLSGDAKTFQKAQIVFEPQKTGEITYRIRLVPQDGEERTENNARRFTVTVTDRKLAVLYVEGWPRFEWRHLVNALSRDPSIRFNGWLCSADPGWPQPVSLEGDDERDDRVQRLSHLPKTREEWNAFDVVIWGDVPPDRFPAEAYGALEEWVAEDGGGLVLIAGRRYMPDAYLSAEFQNLLPVSYRLDHSTALDTAREKPYRVSGAGRQSRLLQISDAEADPARLFAPRKKGGPHRLQGFYWMKRVREWKPSATILATHPDSAGDKAPLGVIGFSAYGRGAVLFHATDETWRWRRLYGDQYFYRYWQNAIRFVSTERFAGKQKGYELRVEERRVHLGESVKVFARPISPEALRLINETSGSQARELPVGYRLEIPGAADRGAVLRRGGESGRFFTGGFRPTRAGRYSVWIKGLEASESAPLSVEVAVPDVETRNLSPDPDTAAAMATRRIAAPGERPANVGLGQRNVYTPATAGLLSIPAHARDLDTRVTHRELWDNPRFFLLFIGLLALEWTLRRLGRMA